MSLVSMQSVALDELEKGSKVNILIFKDLGFRETLLNLHMRKQCCKRRHSDLFADKRQVLQWGLLLMLWHRQRMASCYGAWDTFIQVGQDILP